MGRTPTWESDRNTYRAGRQIIARMMRRIRARCDLGHALQATALASHDLTRIGFRAGFHASLGSYAARALRSCQRRS